MDNKNKKISIILLIIVAIVISTYIVGIVQVLTFVVSMFIPVSIVVGAVMCAQKSNKTIEDIQKTDSEIESLQKTYDEICLNQKANLRKVNNKILINTILVILFTIGAIILLIKYNKFDYIFWLLVVSFIVEMIVWCFIDKHKSFYFGKIINEFIEATNNSEQKLKYIFKNDKILYNETERIVAKEYYKYKENRRWRWISNDYIHGTILNVPIKFSYGYEKYKSELRSRRYSVYNSLVNNGKTFVIIDFKNVENIKMIFSDTNQNGEELLHIDNEWISNYYKCYSSNKESARKFLTLDFIEFLKNYIEKYKIDFEIIFKDNICIMFHTKEMFSRERIGDICGDKRTMPQHYVVMKFVSELIEKLNEK